MMRSRAATRALFSRRLSSAHNSSRPNRAQNFSHSASVTTPMNTGSSRVFEHVVDCPSGYARGHRRGGRAGDGVLRHVLPHEVGSGLEQAGDDLLAAARTVAFLQRGEHADGAEHAAGHVDHAGPGAQGAAGRPGHVGEPAHHLRHLVERGAILVRAGQEAFLATIDQTRVVDGASVVAEAEALERAGAEILDQYVGLRDQLCGRPRAPRRI